MEHLEKKYADFIQNYDAANVYSWKILLINLKNKLSKIKKSVFQEVFNESEETYKPQITEKTSLELEDKITPLRLEKTGESISVGKAENAKNVEQPTLSEKDDDPINANLPGIFSNYFIGEENISNEEFFKKFGFYKTTYPPSFILFYQDEILYKPFSVPMHPKQAKYIQRVEKSCTDIPTRKTNLTLSYLLLAKTYFADEKFQSYKCLLQAIKQPAKYYEESFLNFKAQKVLKELFKQCVVENNWVDTKHPWCAPQNNSPSRVERIVQEKFKSMIMYDSIIESFKNEIQQDNIKNIDKAMNTVIRAAAKFNFVKENDEEITRNIHISINLLTNYAEKIKNTHQNNDEGNYIYDENENEDTYKIYMWLAALYGAKCTLKNDVNCNEIFIESFIQNAKSLNRETDDYITYLETKFKCLKLLDLDFWKNHKKPDGWNLKKDMNVTEKDDQSEIMSLKSQCIDNFSDLTNTNNDYINTTEVFMYLGLIYWNDDSVKLSFEHLNKAVKQMVIDDMDHYYHAVAHKIYDTYLIRHNYNLHVVTENNDEDWEHLIFEIKEIYTEHDYYDENADYE